MIDHLFSTRETEKITRTNTNFVYTDINNGKCLHFFYIRKYSRHIVHFLTLSSGYFSCRFNAKPQQTFTSILVVYMYNLKLAVVQSSPFFFHRSLFVYCELNKLVQAIVFGYVTPDVQVSDSVFFIYWFMVSNMCIHVCYHFRC